MDNVGYCAFCTVNCTVSMPCPSSNITLRKSNTWDIHNIPIVWYHYYTYNVQIVFSSIITLIAINYSFLFPCFFFCIAGGTWRFCVATSHFLVTGKNTTSPGSPSVATAGTSIYVCIVQMRSHKCFVDCKQLFPW